MCSVHTAIQVLFSLKFFFAARNRFSKFFFSQNDVCTLRFIRCLPSNLRLKLSIQQLQHSRLKLNFRDESTSLIIRFSTRNTEHFIWFYSLFNAKLKLKIENKKKNK